MKDWKSTLSSKTVWAGIITLAASVLSIVWKIDITQELQQVIVDQAVQIVTAITGALAIYGRITASAKIGTPPATNSTTEATD